MVLLYNASLSKKQADDDFKIIEAMYQAGDYIKASQKMDLLLRAWPKEANYLVLGAQIFLAIDEPVQHKNYF